MPRKAAKAPPKKAATKRKSASKRDLILKSAKRRKRGVSVTVIAEECDCSTTYVRMVLRDAGYGPTPGQGRKEPIWSAA